HDVSQGHEIIAAFMIQALKRASFGLAYLSKPNAPTATSTASWEGMPIENSQYTISGITSGPLDLRFSSSSWAQWWCCSFSPRA
ncbi:hypothetical protein, partial [uncultured Parvibaculum sp.]|uniref:hypothetical protein n=1 Tax=uncultured Parvibaculum sp. TaxID=291828 RepID=UPI0030DA9A24